MRWFQVRHNLVLVIALASITRAVWFWRAVYVRAKDPPPDATSDGGQYLVAAKNLRFHHVFSFAPDLSPTYFRAPGYSMMIAPLFTSDSVYPIKSILLMHAVLGIATAALVYLIAMHFGRRIAVTAGVAMALAPMSGVFISEILTETLYTFLITLAVFFWGRTNWRWAGFAFGLSWLVRPTTMAFLLFAIAITLIVRAQRRFVLLMAAVALITVLPWIVRNWIVFHKVVPVAVAGGRMNLYFGTLELHYGEDIWKQTLVPENMPAYAWDDPRSEDVYLQRAMNRIKERPFRWAINRIKQYPRLLIDLGAYLHPPSRAGTLVVKTIFLVGNIAVLLLALWGGYVARMHFELILFPIFTLLFHLPMWVEPRYSLPMMPTVIVLAVYGTYHLIKHNPIYSGLSSRGR